MFVSAELEGKDVEEVFTAVLSPHSNNQHPEQGQHLHTAAGNKMHAQHTGTVCQCLTIMREQNQRSKLIQIQIELISQTVCFQAAGVFPRLPVMNGLMGAAPHFPHAPMMPSGVQGPPGFRLPPPEVPAPAHCPTSQAPAGESEQDVMSTAQRGMLKWEKEETLGELATVAPVLYCNTNFPQLKEQYPGTHTHASNTHTHTSI